MNALTRPAQVQEDTWVPYVPYVEQPGAARTTKNLALAALTTDKPAVPYVGHERTFAYAIGAVMQGLLNADMANHRESRMPGKNFSTLSFQLLHTYQQLQFGGGAVEKKMRELFLLEFGHYPCDIRDIRGGKKRLQDAKYVIGIVRKFCPWPDIVEDFERCVFADDRYLGREFAQYFFWVFRQGLKGRALVPGRNTARDATNTATLLAEQDGNVVRLTFGSRWPLNRGVISFAGELGDRTGATFQVERSTMSFAQALAALESFNFRGNGESITLDSRARALGAKGYATVVDPKRGVPVIIDTRGLWR